MISEVLDTRGILYDWVSEDYHAKKRYDNLITYNTFLILHLTMFTNYE